MIQKVKEFFNIEGGYIYETGDLRALIQIINVALIMAFGLSVSWFGLVIAFLGLVKDLHGDRRINSIIMHTSSVVLNCYFLHLLYMGA